MDAEQGLPLPQRYWAILVVALGITLAVLDGAIANVALPTIARNLNASPADSIWVVNAYQLAITISLLPLASLGDRIGYRRVYMAGLALFTIASFGCALSGSLTSLAHCARDTGLRRGGHHERQHGLGAHDLPPLASRPRRQHQRLVVAISSVIGPTSLPAFWRSQHGRGSLRSTCRSVSRRIAAGWKALPRTPGHGQPYDYLSALMNAVVFGLADHGVDGLGHGEHRQLRRLANFSLARRDRLLLRAAAADASRAAPAYRPAANPGVRAVHRHVLLFVQPRRCWPSSRCRSCCRTPSACSQVQTGFLMTPWPLVIVFVAPLAGMLSDRYSAGALGGIGLAIMTVGLLLLATTGAHPAPVDIAWRMACAALGFGFFQSPNNRQMLSVGAASSQRRRKRHARHRAALGQTLGAALVALIFGIAPQHGTIITLFVAAGFAAAAAMVSLMRISRSNTPATA